MDGLVIPVIINRDKFVRALEIFGDERVNINEKICAGGVLGLGNTMYKHKKIKGRGKCKNRIDYEIVDEYLKSRVLNTLVYPGAGINTADYLVIVGISGLL